MGQLDGKRIIVSGGASGMGAAVVRAYLAEGAQVISLDIDDKAGETVLNESKARKNGSFLHCDVSNRNEVDTCFEQSLTRLGGLDVLVNAAGIERACPAEEISDQQWDDIFDVNMKGTVYTNQAAFKSMKDTGGRIINFGSAAGVAGMPGGADYSASKAAVMAWTRTAAQEWGQYNITVNAMAPVIETPMAQTNFARMSPAEFEAFKAAMTQRIPLSGWFGDPDRDFAPVMIFLASDGARYLTGQTYAVDGGMMMMKA
jgi:2-hydroxycyclohexanecarboxyl-CoA dehydrogenase